MEYLLIGLAVIQFVYSVYALTTGEVFNFFKLSFWVDPDDDNSVGSDLRGFFVRRDEHPNIYWRTTAYLICALPIYVFAYVYVYLIK